MNKLLLSRRNALGLAAVASSTALLPGLPGCSDITVASARRIPTAPKTVHVRLTRGNGSALFTEAQSSRIFVRVAGKTHRLQSHAEESLARWKSRSTGGAKRVPSHFVENLHLSVVGAQVVEALFFPINGPPVPVALSVHVPRTTGNQSYVPDTDHVVDEDAAALWCIFQDPAILACDPDVAARVLSIAASTQELRVLSNRIAQLQWAISPEEAEQGYGGWVRGIYRKDAAGNRVPLVNPDGSAVVDAQGQPVFEYSWEPHPDVARFTLNAVGEILRRIHDDADLAKVGKFDTQPGVPLTVPIGRSAALAASGLREEERNFVFAHQGQKREGRTLELEEQEGSTSRFEAKLTNALPLGVGWGISHFNENGALISSQCFGYVPATFYAGVSIAWKGRSKGESIIDLPDGATRSTLWTTAFAFRDGDAVLPPAQETLGFALELGVTCATMGSLILDFFMPTFMLIAGTGGEKVEEAVKRPIVEVLEEVGLDALKELVIAIVNTGARAVTGAEVREYIKREGPSIIYSALRNLLTGAASALIKRAAERLLAALAEAMLLITAESALEAAIPVVGWALKVLNLAETGVQLGLAVGASATEGAVTKSDLERVHTVKVTAKPFESAYFPLSAVRYTASLSVGSVAVFKNDGPFAKDGTSGSEIAKLEAFEGVPAVGKCSLSVQLYDLADRVIGTSLLTFEADKRPGLEQEIDIEIEGKAIPVESMQKLVHDRRLERQGSAWQWKSTQVPPAAGPDAFACVPSDGKVGVCAVTGLTVSQKRGLLGLAFATPVGTPPIISQVAIDVSIVKPAPPFNGSAGGDRLTSVYVVHGLGDVHVVLASDSGGALMVYSFDPDGDLGTFVRGGARPRVLGKLSGVSLVHARIHPLTSTLVALTEVGIETLALDRPDPQEAHLFGRRGAQAGQLSGPVAVAPFRDQAQMLVLEQGARRAQVLDFYGNPVAAFGGPWLGLSKDPRVQYLDCDVSDKGYAWILSATAQTSGATVFDLDIYSPDGLLVKAFGGIAAARFALDRYNDLFSLAFENAPGPRDYPVPTVSAWHPA